MDYATKKDIVERYTNKRKVLNTEDVEDLLDTFVDYVLSKIEKVDSKDIFAYNISGFGEIYEDDFDPRLLVSERNTQIRSKTENKLHEYILTGIIRPNKEISIKDDRIFRT